MTAHSDFRWLLLAMLVGVAVAFASFATVSVLQSTTTTADETAEAVKRFQQVFVAEKVCSLSNEGEPCRALFNRLARSLSEAQRFRLACDVLSPLDIPDAVRWAREAKCPPPIPSP